MRSKRLHGRPNPLPPWPRSAKGPMEPKTQAASLPKPLWPPNTRPPSSPFPRVLCGVQTKAHGRTTGWESLDERAITIHPTPDTSSPSSKCPGFLVPKKPRALPRSASGEKKATWTLYCSTEKDTIGSLGPLIFLSQDVSLPLVVETHMTCPRARRTGRDPGEGETVGTPHLQYALGKA